MDNTCNAQLSTDLPNSGLASNERSSSLLNEVRTCTQSPDMQKSVALMGRLDRAACAICDTIRSRRGNRCNHCRADTETRDSDGKCFSTSHQYATTGQPTPATNLPYSTIPSSPIRDITINHRQRHSITWSCGALFPVAPQRWQRALKVLTMFTSREPNFANIAANSCWRNVPKNLIKMLNSKDSCS